MDTLCNQTASPVYYPSKENTWTGVRWSYVEKTIDKLQHRITKAAERGDKRKVRNLQHLLTRSYAARLKAVRIVAQENDGKKTPGIDKEIWTNPNRKIQESQALHKKQRTKPVRRIYIPKSNGNRRSLGIPCMSDRARQALWNMALTPFTEATSDPHSYGFRPYRDCWDANAQLRILLDKRNSPEWILDADIEKCFDTINHDWLLSNTPMAKGTLKSWLKAGYFEGDHLFPIDEGTPQGGIISPTLANLTLNGLEYYLKETFPSGKIQKYYPSGYKNGFKKIETGINLVRYADDFIITGKSKRQLERVKKAIIEFLKPRGLKINEEKTSIRHISEGFEFLGWTFKKYTNNKLLCKISKNSISRHKKDLKFNIRTNSKPEILIPLLNSKIRGWMNYHQCTNGLWNVWNHMNKYVYERMMKWCRRRHPKKTKKWLYDYYWKSINNCKTFQYKNSNENKYILKHYDLQQKKIRTRLSVYINIFDLNNKELVRKKVLHKRQTLSSLKEKLWRKQKCLCPSCNHYLTPKDNILDIHHIIPKKEGGSDKLTNLVLVHEHCHYTIHSNAASKIKNI
uniref:Reverse transcriptase domain-containing protein n=1 Tax=Ulva rigida TaxID=75689 RepID=A0A8F0HZ75_9CHLO|nr:hypothetical protein [Ulva rigida]